VRIIFAAGTTAFGPTLLTRMLQQVSSYEIRHHDSILGRHSLTRRGSAPITLNEAGAIPFTKIKQPAYKEWKLTSWSVLLEYLSAGSFGGPYLFVVMAWMIGFPGAAVGLRFVSASGHQ
jgi:hypothetical protein